MNLHRKVSLLLLALLLLPMGRVCAQPAALRQRLAVQLWSFRNDFARDVPGTLRRVRELGFVNVELAGYYGMTARQFRAELDKAGLRAVGMHIEFETARDKIDEVIADARVFGLREIAVPWINSPFTKKDCLAAIEVFNRAGRRLAAQGFFFSYHLHGYEFVPNEDGAGTLFDLLLAKTDPRFVHLQLDTYHVAFPGQDPVRLLQKHAGRFRTLHLKDLRRETVGDHSGDFREADARPLGQGRIDWPALLREARRQSVKWYIVEEETAAVWQAVTESMQYLATLKTR